MPERLGGGEVVAARPWVVEDVDGGVLGREPEPDRFRDSNLRISACEYDAPTTRFGSRAGFFPAILVSLWAALKKGDVESDRSSNRCNC